MTTSYNAVPTVATGDWITAGWINTYIGDNFVANWPGTTQGDTEYYNSATEKARLAIGGNGYYYASNGTIPVWLRRIRIMPFTLNTDVALAGGDDAVHFRIPADLAGYNIIYAAVGRSSGSSGAMALQLRNITDGVDVFSSSAKLTIDSGGTDSKTATTPVVIDTAHDDVAEGDMFSWDVDTPGTSYHVAGNLGFAKP